MTHFKLQLPTWIDDHLASADFSTETLEDRMDFVITLAHLNVKNNTGGPFGAAIFDRDSGKRLSCGVNLVNSQNCSLLHAEIVAIIFAQKHLGHYDLGASGMPSCQLVTSVEPCAMCLGAIGWSGIRQVVCGARDADARKIGFDEGIKPENWVEKFNRQGINIIQDIMRDQACNVLKNYQETGGLIYNPDNNREV